MANRLRALAGALGALVRGSVDGTTIEGPARRVLAAIIALGALGFFALAETRYATFHNYTFDLAFYARMSWGVIANDPWEPLVDAHAWGLHLVWILRPLAPLGALFGHVHVLLAAQALAVAAVAWPLARVGARHLGGARGGLLVALVWLLQPNLGHVAGEDFHPGSMAALPLAWCIDALDRKSPEGLLCWVLGVLACREDLGLVTAVVGLLAMLTDRSLRRTGALLSLLSLAYVATFLFVLHPRYAPAAGSLQLHFGRLGGSASEVVVTALTRPGELVEHLSVPHRLRYLPLVAAPLAFLPFLAPRWLLPAAPVLAINLVSEFPGTTDLSSHYLTPALPFLVGAAIFGAARLPLALRSLASEQTVLVRGRAVLALAALSGHLAAGHSPLAPGFAWDEHVDDEDARAARAIVARVDPEAAIQAPDALLPHLAERRMLRRAPPPETLARYVVLDAWHRREHAHQESLLRMDEEPLVRAWIAREDHALVLAAGRYLLFERERDPRTGVGWQAVVGDGDPEAGRALCACLALLDASVSEGALVLDLVARAPCPDDLALRIGPGHRPARVDLVAEGLVSPAHLRRGDRVRSRHSLAIGELQTWRALGLRVGAVRSSGAPPEHGDPPAIDVPL